MPNELEFKTIIDSIYPLTITSDRYTGTYSDGNYTAWNLEPSEVPEAIFGDDCDCHSFWLHNNIVCGKGNTIEEAVGNLYIALKEQENDTAYEKENEYNGLL